MAGYSKTPLSKKLGYKSGYQVLLVNSPELYKESLVPLPADLTFVEFDNAKEVDLVHVFVKSQTELDRYLLICKSKIKKSGMIWVSWPKKSSKIVSDLDSNIIRNAGLMVGLVDIKVAAIDEIWSGLKFVYRKEDR